MAKVTILAAAKLAGISRANFYKNYVNTGTITVGKNVKGRPEIDTSEILRVFGEIKCAPGETQGIHNEIHKVTLAKDSEDSMLQIEVRILREQLSEAKDREEWLKQKVDSLSSANIFLLENKQPEQPKKKRFWLF